MVEVDQDEHPGLYRYSIELLEYPELTDEQYVGVMTDLEKPETDPAHIAAREKLICAHLGMILATAIHHSNDFFISPEDFVGIGNEALVTEFSKFSPNRNARFSTFMRKIVRSWILKNIRAHTIWNRNDEIDVEYIGRSGLLYSDCRYEYLYRAMEDLSQQERDVIHYTFFDDYNPSDRQIAKKMHISKYYLVETRNEIFEKLRSKITGWRQHLPNRPYVIGTHENELEQEENNVRN